MLEASPTQVTHPKLPANNKQYCAAENASGGVVVAEFVHQSIFCVSMIMNVFLTGLFV